MNIPTSDYNYSSGCESGWTVYFDQLSNSVDHQYQQNRDLSCEDQENNEDEDLSMVSDASSGPPHYNGFQYDHDQNNYFAGGGGGGGAADGGVYSQYYGGGDGGGGGAADGGVYSQYYGYHAPPSDIKKKSGKNASKKKTQCLDDTASSPDFDFSRDNVPPTDHFSHAISSEHVEGEYSMTKKKFGFFKSSGKGKSSSFLGRKRQ